MSDNIVKLVPLREESRLFVKRAADIKPQKIDWLWEGSGKSACLSASAYSSPAKVGLASRCFSHGLLLP